MASRMLGINAVFHDPAVTRMLRRPGSTAAERLEAEIVAG